MFSKNKEESKELLSSQNGTHRNVISVGTTMVGNIKSEGDFRIDGTIDGTIETSGRILVGQKGSVIGTLICTNAEVEGKISGVVKVKELMSLKSTAVINGEIYVGKLAIEPGAIFDATCAMTDKVKSLNGRQEKQQKVS